MIQLYDFKTISSIDKHTIASGISSSELIDNAANAFVYWFLPRITKDQVIHVFCGTGNNGADGLSISLKLANYGYSIVVFALDSDNGLSSENISLRSKVVARNDVQYRIITTLQDLKFTTPNTVLIDSLLGNGVNRQLTGFYAELVTHLNSTYQEIYAVDCPSGLLDHNQRTDLAINAKATFSFEFPKLSFFAPENEIFVGKWYFASIGLIEPRLKKATTKYYLIEQKDVDSIFIKRSDFSHKGLMGNSLFLMTNDHMLGASLLAAKACFKMGAGKVFGYCSDNLLTSLSIREPEIIFKSKDLMTLIRLPNALCMGPGLGMNQASISIVETILETYKATLLLDADALNIIAKNKWVDRIPKNSIITPHIKEFERLFGHFSSHQKRVKAQCTLSKKYKIIIILKGRYTSISDIRGNLYYNQSGNPSLSKGGSGDVLAGMITSLISQNYNLLQACLAGVWIHGLAADKYVQTFHEKTLTPLSLIDYIAKALNDNKICS